MTLQINEVSVRMHVGDERGAGATPGGTASPSTGGCREADKEAIVQEAVRRTLKMLRANGER